MIKLLIGGSPCTHWSIAQSKNRETKAEGIGWELFLNYVIAKEKFKPDFFLYENNWSASKEIKKQIQHELGQELMRINSSLVSAQNRDRFYVFNWKVEQPEDRGVLLKDILETGKLMGRKSLDINVSHPEDGGDKMPECQSGTHLMTTAPLVTTLDGKSFCITATEYKGSTPQQTIEKKRRTMVAEPVKQGTANCVRVGIKPNLKGNAIDCQSMRIYSTDGKSRNLTSASGGNGTQTGLYAVPVAGRLVGRRLDREGKRDDKNTSIDFVQRIVVNKKAAKTNCLTSVLKDNIIIEPMRVREATKKGYTDIEVGECVDLAMENSKTRRERRMNEKSNCLTTTFQYVGVSGDEQFQECNYELVQGAEFFVANNKIRQGDKNGSKQGKYVYLPCCEKSNTIGAGQAHNEKVLQRISNISKYKNIYEVEDNKILIKGKWYPIKLRDGKYVIRKLTPVECERLQTLPDGYTAAVSDTQRYKGLGNGWTAEVIIHILQGALQNVPRDEKIVVLSMYDGIGTGRYCLEKMGFTNVEYHAYEIDKYAIKVAMSNYPDIIQHGDAFQVREDDWNLL